MIKFLKIVYLFTQRTLPFYESLLDISCMEAIKEYLSVVKERNVYRKF